MSSRVLLLEQRQRIWSPLPELISDEGFRTLHPGSSQFSLTPEQVQVWANFAKEVKELVDPHCGEFKTFAPVTVPEVFGVANELGVQGRLVQNALHQVGELSNILNLGIRFGDSQYGVNRALIEGSGQQKTGAKKESKRKRGEAQRFAAGDKLVPDLIVADVKTHAIRGVGEVKTYWKFEPKNKQTLEEFIADKIGQLARYMDDRYCKYGFFSIYERTWFVKRIDNDHFALSPPILYKAKPSDTEVSLRECFFATALRAAKLEDSRYNTKVGDRLTRPGIRSRLTIRSTRNTKRIEC